MQPVEQGFQRLKQFTADPSHELRGPLMAIKSNVAVALKYPEECHRCRKVPSDCQRCQANDATYRRSTLLARSESSSAKIASP